MWSCTLWTRSRFIWNLPAVFPALSGLTHFGSRAAPRARLHVWGWSESCRLFAGLQACKQSSGPWWDSKQIQIGSGPTVECLLLCLLALIFKTAASRHIKRVSSCRGGSVGIWKIEASASCDSNSLVWVQESFVALLSWSICLYSTKSHEVFFSPHRQSLDSTYFLFVVPLRALWALIVLCWPSDRFLSLEPCLCFIRLTLPVARLCFLTGSTRVFFQRWKRGVQSDDAFLPAVGVCLASRRANAR